jgi:DNA-binding NarL/FixJ family response regulator
MKAHELTDTGKSAKKEITILLAEDHVVVRESIHQSLERQPNFKVVGEANNGEEAVEMTKRLKPDVIIMDISMPKLNGIEATKQIKAFQPSAVILVLTAYDYEQYIFPLLAAGAAGYLLKDVSSRELINAIQTVYRGESVLHPAIARKVLGRFRYAKGEATEEQPSDLLTDRETVVLKMAAKGMSNSAIAEEMHLSVRTIESYLGAIFNKLGVGSRTEAVIQAMKRGWFTLEELT